MGEFFAILALLLWAGNVFVVRYASPRLAQQHGFFVVLVVNVAFAALLFSLRFFGVPFLGGGHPFAIDTGAVLVFALAGILANYFGRRGFFLSVVSLGPARASVVQIISPVFAGIGAWLFLQQGLSSLNLVGFLLTLVGLFLSGRQPRQRGATVAAGVVARSLALRSTWLLPGLGIAIGSAAAYGIGNVLRASVIARWDEPIFGGMVGSATAAVTYALLHVRARTVIPGLLGARPGGMVLWVLSGILSISAQISVIAASSYLPIAIVLAVSSALPVIVMPLSYLLFRDSDRTTRATILGAALVLAGVLLVLFT